MADRHSTAQRLLLTIPEIVELTGRSYRQVQRWLERDDVYVEYQISRTRAGNRARMAFVDPATLPHGMAADLLNGLALQPEAVPRSEVVETSLSQAESIDAAVQIASSLPPDERGLAVPGIAKRFGVSKRTVYRRLSKLRRGQSDAPRTDVGRPRIPLVARELIVRALVSNPPTTSARMIHRTLLRAAPDAMTYERADGTQVVSVRTVLRVREELLANPHTRLLLSDADERAEYLRVFSGAVLAEHANELWQMDMTRCDILVVDPSSGKVYRPRVHAIIDVYSGVVPGIAFSEEEGQAQTDLTLLRALLPKRGPYADRYPYWGVPKRIYWDNGSTYKSAHARRVLAGLGIEDVHSRPYVSHTRGDIERFFGTLHNLEKALPGYVGENASARAAKEIKRLERNTREWLRHRRDPGEGNRLLTISEYQNVVLAWLVSEYHPWVVNGLSRHEHFVRTAPASSLVEIDQRELLLLLAHRTERTVDAAGRIRLDNRFWSIPDGSLAPYQGVRVMVLTDQFALEPERRLVAWPDHSGRLNVIGVAEPAPEAAASIEAQNHRRAARVALVEAGRRQREMKRELTDPNVRVSTVLLREFRAAGGEELPPAARAQLESVNPVREVIEFAPDDVLGQQLLRQRERKGAPTDPVELARWIADRHGKGRGGQ